MNVLLLHCYIPQDLILLIKGPTVDDLNPAVPEGP